MSFLAAWHFVFTSQTFLFPVDIALGRNVWSKGSKELFHPQMLFTVW